MQIFIALGASYIPVLLLVGILFIIRLLVGILTTTQPIKATLFSKPYFWVGILIPGILGVVGFSLFHLFDLNPWQLYIQFMFGMIIMHFFITIVAMLTNRPLGLGLLAGSFSLIILLAMLSPH